MAGMVYSHCQARNSGIEQRTLIRWAVALLMPGRRSESCVPSCVCCVAPVLLQSLKNLSVLKLAAAHEPPVPTRLYKPLNWWRQMWMKRKLESAKTVLGWDAQNAKLLAPGGGGGRGMLPTSVAARAAAPTVSVSFETRVQALAKQLQARSQQPAVAPDLVHR